METVLHLHFQTKHTYVVSIVRKKLKLLYKNNTNENPNPQKGQSNCQSDVKHAYLIGIFFPILEKGPV